MTGIHYSLEHEGWVVSIGATFPDNKGDNSETIGIEPTMAEAISVLFSALLEKIEEQRAAALGALQLSDFDNKLELARLEVARLTLLFGPQIALPQGDALQEGVSKEGEAP